MRPPESFVGQPIRSLQTMLRVIAESDESLPSVVPDGIYGQQTMTAISAFQRKYGIPVTGIADQNTWDHIVAVFEPALILIDEAEPLYLIFDPLEVITDGQFHPNLFVVQGMLNVFALSYPAIIAPALSGILDIPTTQALLSFQELNGLPMTGNLDKITWKNLALQYPSAAAQAQNRKSSPINTDII